jgi:ERCC4-type nuclease
MESKNINIIIDDREKALFCYFEKLMFHFEIKRLSIGDYLIRNGENIICIVERKTWKDLSQSFRDGRKKNIEKLEKLRNETGALIMYIIEGTPRPSDKRKFARISHKNLRAHLDHLMFRNNVHIQHTLNKRDSIRRLNEICRNLLTLSGGCITGGKSDIIFEPQKKTEKDIYIDLWCGFKGISVATAEVMCQFPISDFISGKLKSDFISELKILNGKKIGEKRAEKIYGNRRKYRNVIAKIPSIGEKTMEIIEPHMKAIVRAGISLSEIESIEVIKKNVAKNIYHYIHESNQNPITQD